MKTWRVGTRAICASVVAILAGCGGGSGGTTSGSTGSGGGGGGGPPPPATLSGQFIDAPAKGLTYKASPSGLSGTTDANGTFSFQKGDTVVFSLGAGGSNSLSLGSVAPASPTSGSATVFVLSLPNGIQVAQVLQSLNHGSASSMDLSGLTLSAQDTTNLNTYITTGGTVLPASDATDLQMLYQAQQDATINGSAATSGTFVVSGGASVSATIGALQQTVTKLTANSSVDLSTILPGKVVFHEGLVMGSNGAQEDFGIDYFSSGGSVAGLSSNANNSINQGSPTYTTKNNLLTITNTSISDTITISYIDSVQGLWTDSSSDGSSGAGSYVFLQTWKPADIAGKTLTVTGAMSSGCGGAPLQLVIDAAGASYTVNCQGSTQQQGSGSIAVVSAIPGLISFTDHSSGATYNMGLLTGGTAASGTIAVIETHAPAGKSITNGVFGLTSK